MRSIARLRTFDVEELFELLKACAQNLAMAYQEIPEQSLFLISEEAYSACDYLAYEIRKSEPRQIH
jgi:hypothetical protein